MKVFARVFKQSGEVLNPSFALCSLLLLYSLSQKIHINNSAAHADLSDSFAFQLVTPLLLALSYLVS